MNLFRVRFLYREIMCSNKKYYEKSNVFIIVIIFRIIIMYATYRV